MVNVLQSLYWAKTTLTEFSYGKVSFFLQLESKREVVKCQFFPYLPNLANHSAIIFKTTARQRFQTSCALDMWIYYNDILHNFIYYHNISWKSRLMRNAYISPHIYKSCNGLLGTTVCVIWFRLKSYVTWLIMIWMNVTAWFQCIRIVSYAVTYLWVHVKEVRGAGRVTLRGHLYSSVVRRDTCVKSHHRHVMGKVLKRTFHLELLIDHLEGDKRFSN